MMKLIDAFYNFANAPKYQTYGLNWITGYLIN